MLNLQKLAETLQGLGTAESQREVSALAARKGSWLSSTISHGRRASTGSLVALLFNIKDIVAETLAAADGTADQEEKKAYEAGAADLQGWVQQIEAELRRRIEHHET